MHYYVFLETYAYKPETTQCEEITTLMRSIIMSSDHVKFQGCEITDTISRINLDILMGSYTILAPSPIKRKQWLPGKPTWEWRVLSNLLWRRVLMEVLHCLNWGSQVRMGNDSRHLASLPAQEEAVSARDTFLIVEKIVINLWCYEEEGVCSWLLTC